MREITELKVVQCRIFPADSIPTAHLKTRNGHDLLMKRFGFSSAGLSPITEEIVLESGSIDLPEKGLIVVERIQLSARRTIISVSGTSSVASAVHDTLLRLITPENEGRGSTVPIPVLLREDTSCVATLAFDAIRLLPRSSRRFLESVLLPRTTDAVGRSSLIMPHFSLDLRYDPVSEDVVGHGIVLAPKTFTVEPRADTPLSARRYYTASPTDSETHLALLEAFEQSVLNEKDG